MIPEMAKSDLQYANSNWEGKHPILNLTWDEIRNIVRQLADTEGDGIFGTPTGVRTNNLNRAIVAVQFSNLQDEQATNELGRKVAEALAKLSGRQVKFKGWSTTTGSTQYEPGRSAENPDMPGSFDYSSHETWTTKDTARFEFTDTSTGEIG